MLSYPLIDGFEVEPWDTIMLEADQSAASVSLTRMTIQIADANPRGTMMIMVKICDSPFGMVGSARELECHGRMLQFETHAVNIEHLQKIQINYPNLSYENVVVAKNVFYY